MEGIIFIKDIRNLRMGKYMFPVYNEEHYEYRENAIRLRTLFAQKEKTFSKDKKNFDVEIEMLIDRQIILHDKAKQIKTLNFNNMLTQKNYLVAQRAIKQQAIANTSLIY